MRVKAYPILVRCLEEGILSGLNKAQKREYLELKDEHAAAEQVQDYVMNELCEVFSFDDETEDETPGGW